VTWENQGRQFQSKLVYDENGVVYDNMLSNIAVMEADEVSPDKLPGPPAPRSPPRSPAGSPRSPTNRSNTRFLDVTIRWHGAPRAARSR